MESQTEHNLEKHLQTLEAEINSPPTRLDLPERQIPLQPQANNSQVLQPQLNRLINWFNSLSSWGKLIVAGMAIVAGFTILRVVLTLVIAVISLAVIVGLLYFVYQFFLAPSAETKD